MRLWRARRLLSVLPPHVMVTVYVLRGSAGKRYVGITHNLNRRLAEHRSGATKAGHLLGEFEVIHQESFPDHATARQREKFLKSGQGRKWMYRLAYGSRLLSRIDPA